MASLLSTLCYAETPPGGFPDLLAFVQALEEMPAAEFARLAAETPYNTLHDFRGSLAKMNPAHFEIWNQKLRMIPGPGFLANTNYWELHAKGPEMTVGFKPEVKPGAFVSIVDFYESLSMDEVSVFQARANETATSDLNRWLTAIQKRNPDLFEYAMTKANVMRTIGFRPDSEYRMIEPELPPPGPIGFNAGSEVPAKLPMIRSSAEIIALMETATPEELKARLLQMSDAQANRILGALKKNQPAKYQELIGMLASRTKIGFTTSAQPEIIPPTPKSTEPPAKIGFRPADGNCADFLKPQP